MKHKALLTALSVFTAFACILGSAACANGDPDPDHGKDEHTHSYSSEWESDDTDHWHECTECGAARSERAAQMGRRHSDRTVRLRHDGHGKVRLHGLRQRKDGKRRPPARIPLKQNGLTTKPPTGTPRPADTTSFPNKASTNGTNKTFARCAGTECNTPRDWNTERREAFKTQSLPSHPSERQRIQTS